MNLESLAAATCSLNGQIVPCEKFTSFLGWGVGGVIFLIILFTLAFVFWVIMLVHAIKHPIEHKPLWILILLLTGIVGAIVYYFAVKREPLASSSIGTAV